MVLKSRMKKRKLDRISKLNTSLSKHNKELMDENAFLKLKIASLEQIIVKIQDLEEEYRSGIAETKELKAKYQDAVNNVNKIKESYSKQMKSFMKDMKKQL